MKEVDIMDLTKEARKKIKEYKGFITNNNYNVVEVKENYCKLEGILTETSLNNLNIAHGGYLFGLADTAGGIAAMTDGKLVVTVNSNISYIKPAKGEKLVAVANCIQKGKTISVYEVEIYDIENDMVAKANITYFYVK